MPPVALTPFAEGIWLEAAPVRILGTRLTSTMAVVRLSDGGLLLWSPVPMTPERRAAVEALGRVAHLYSPNLFHHLWIGDWKRAFPSARLHAPGGLSKKRPDLEIDRPHRQGLPPELATTLDEHYVHGFRLHESVLFHRPSRTLIAADLVQNVGTPESGWTRIYTKAMGFYDRVALSKAIRWTAFSDRRAARQSVDELLAKPFERLIVGHGAPIAEGAQTALSEAYRWLQ